MGLSTSAIRLLDDLQDRHHARVLVVEDVAVQDRLTGEVREVDPDDDLTRESSYVTGSVYGSGHALYYQNVVEVLRGRCEPDTDGREGLRSLELLTAMYISARDGRRVSLPLEH